MLEYFTLVDTTQCDTAQWYFTSESQYIWDCSKFYTKEKRTNKIVSNIQELKSRK